jgi:hypothetical protein
MFNQLPARPPNPSQPRVDAVCRHDDGQMQESVSPTFRSPNQIKPGSFIFQRNRTKKPPEKSGGYDWF